MIKENNNETLPDWITEILNDDWHRRDLKHMIEAVNREPKKSPEQIKWEDEQKEKVLEFKRKNITHDWRGRPIIYPKKWTY